MEPLYTRDGDAFIPSKWTTGPWYEHAQHGGPPAALLVRALEAYDSPIPVQLVHINVQLLRPVPLVPLTLEVGPHSFEAPRPARPRRVQRLQATLYAGAEPVATAFGLRIRTRDVELPGDLPPAERLLDPSTLSADQVAFGGFHDANEFRFIQGSFEQPGRGIAWLRLKHQLVAAEQLSGAVRAVAAADFANGVGAVLDIKDYLFLNPDLSVQLYRQPEGEWIGLESLARVSPAGVGMTDTLLYDAHGVAGRAVQSLVVERRP